MTYLEMNFRSHALNMNVPVTVILPEVGTTGPVGGAPEGTYKTLYLLHGLCGNHTDWSRKTSIERPNRASRQEEEWLAGLPGHRQNCLH